MDPGTPTWSAAAARRNCTCKRSATRAAGHHNASMVDANTGKKPPHHCPKKLAGEPTLKFKSARGQPLPVRGCYEFKTRIGTKFLKHEFYVIPDLNEPLILVINFIQKH